MKTRRILSTILALTMLLTLFSGEFASAAGMKIVTAGEELAYDPLAETASIAYEQHEDGYAVTLDRAADSVTMHLTAVPDSGRKAEGARLYIRTGTALKAGTAYRVSFALWSEKKLTEYTACFDGGDAAAAYGKLDKRSVDAGATDRVEYTFTPKAANGELVLRLLLGTTEVNTLRFSDLAVEEAPAEQSGANKLLVDKLNYAAPGAIRCAAEAGYSAEMDSTDTSATMTVTNVPKSGAEVWKLKLMVSTGLKPQPGKTYRFRATLNSSGSGSYEACYNEGEVEKGYDVLYNQSLKSGSQTVERMIYVPTDKENPGELIVQFSLGLLSKGTKVTISKVTVEEASPAYTNALARGFALDTTGMYEAYDPNDLTVTSSALIGSTLIPGTSTSGEAKVWTKGRAGDLTFQNNKVTLKVTAGSIEDDPWNAILHIETYQALAVGKTYLVTFNISSAKAYSEYNVLYSYDGAPGPDNVADRKYGGIFGRSLAANTTDTVQYRFTVGAEDAGKLVLLLQLGKTDNQDNTVTVSNVKIEEVGQSFAGEFADAGFTINYPTLTPGASIAIRDNYGTIISGVGDNVKIRFGTINANDDWQSNLFIDSICEVSLGSSYTFSFDIQADDNKKINTCQVYYRVGERHWTYNPSDPGCVYNRTDLGNTATITGVITPDSNGSLYLRVELRDVEDRAAVTIRNIQVKHNNDIISTVHYPAGSLGDNFYIRDNFGTIYTGGTGAIKVLFSARRENNDDNYNNWRRGVFLEKFCDVDPGYQYQFRFDIQADSGKKINKCEVFYDIGTFRYADEYNRKVFTESAKKKSSPNLRKLRKI